MSNKFSVLFKGVNDLDFTKFEHIGAFERTLLMGDVYYYYIGVDTISFGTYYVFRVVYMGIYKGELFISMY